ncbi:MAG: DEAD/DEAH box helicase family protein [Anaerolineales bacterium]|nr:DEAD/DEAH box helicase family protein [Anaerolineales bacterium]
MAQVSALSFRFAFRKYQRLILEQIEQGMQDRKFHIVAPPGSGKTIIGLELIRRFGVPAVVFAPTTTIQYQWYQKVGMFLPEGTDIDLYATLEPDQNAPIHIFTYQLISVPAEAQLHLQQAALQLWKEELLEKGQVHSLVEAEARLEMLQQNNPDAYRKDLNRYAGRIKHRLLREPNVEIAPFLHENARRLIDQLLSHGVRTVVLDECHHLLAYWAIVLRYFINRIPEPHVVGLTATLPSPEDEEEFENYDSLLGDVDFEVPTPVVVKEGDLAPYRDLVYLVKPTAREYAYLNRIQQEFEQAIDHLRAHPHFQSWLRGLLEIPADVPSPEVVWQTRWENAPLLMLAATRLMIKQGDLRDWPYPIPAEAHEPLDLEDWARLIERFSLDVLKLSPDKQDHRLYQEVRHAIQPFGFTLTERGLQQSRSPGDLVLTFSESKDEAVAKILTAEAKALGERLRAIVVTDFEQVSSGIGRLKGVLGRDAGSAVRVFKYLYEVSSNTLLGTSLGDRFAFLLPVEMAETFMKLFESPELKQDLNYVCKIVPKEQDIAEIDGEGRDWTTRTYVRLATSAFERGLTRCLVGTRGIFGEGWDALSLNTLIDLTSVTTPTSVQQLRGRAIRLDPTWPRKVAHHWDVICVAPEFEKGTLDLRRLVARHKHFWSLVIYSDWFEEVTKTSTRKAPPNLHGRIARGILHVSPDLFLSLLKGYKGFFANFSIDHHNRTMLKQVDYRDWVYDLWEVGAPYSNFSYSTRSLDAKDLKIRTVFTLQSPLSGFGRNTFLAIGSAFAFFWNIFYYSAFVGDLNCIFLILVVGLAGVFIYSSLEFVKLIKKLFTEQVPDDILLDVGRALLHTLRDLSLISPNLQPDYVRVVRNPDDTYQVFLDYASPQDADTFIQAFGEIFEPIHDQRYLIMRTEDRLPNLPLNSIWLGIRKFVRQTGMYPPAYHPVPKILAGRKERVDVFARYWQRYVGGGEVVFTRSEMGRAILLNARSQRRPKVKQMAFEIWK